MYENTRMDLTSRSQLRKPTSSEKDTKPGICPLGAISEDGTVMLADPNHVSALLIYHDPFPPPA